jgi:deoxyribonuclease IV
MELMLEHGIGYHTKKEKTLLKTITDLPTFEIPYQLFLGAPQNTKMALHDNPDEVHELVQKTKASIFVHSQYIINLCSEEKYMTDLLIQNINYAKQCGFQGVVVHVGKYVKTDPEKAVEIMRTNLLRAIEEATEECPILLETPAGQGTETLTTCNEFVDFVKSFHDLRIRVCVDTCHVFATGYDPLSYIEYVYKRGKSLIKLIHFNDSKTECGSCVDRHEIVGEGEIGKKKMEEIAIFCKGKFKMVYEG